ncbi:MAG: glycosyltransferase family 39 protein [Prevotellaceae bacterium]|nr:glycosyltransferase family 39 protein [Prevotellaceae bacterium]
MLYGENLAWGYFDHPPTVGLMIYISNLLFSGNLAVRFLTVLLQFFTLVLTWKLTGEKLADAKKIALFAIIASSTIMFQAYGFITTPDAPFLFFTALFLVVYKKFLCRESWGNTCLLAASMAGMVYSKYHAILIIGLILLSNLRMLMRYKFWIAGFLAIIALIPHICWQVSMNFPTFQFHLSDRSSNFRWNYFLAYFPNQLAVFNPFTFAAAVYILIKYKPKEMFDRGLHFIVVGFILFFCLMNFKGYVEPHWTVVCTIPMIVLIYRHSLTNRKLMRYVKCCIFPSIALVFLARILLVADVLPKRLDFYGKDKRYKAIEAIAEELPVVFTGSFQNPSNYHFFTGKESTVLSAVNVRRTQFDIWQKELDYQGKPVLVCATIPDKSQEYNVDGIKFHAYKTQNFQSVNRLEVNYELQHKEVYIGDTLHITFEVYNPTDFTADFRHSEFPVSWKAVYRVAPKKFEFRDCILDREIATLPAHTKVKGTLKTVAPKLDVVDCQFALSLDNTICPAKNSKFTFLALKKND